MKDTIPHIEPLEKLPGFSGWSAFLVALGFTMLPLLFGLAIALCLR